MGGVIDAIFGSDEVVAPPPEQQIITGDTVKEKAGVALEEGKEVKKTARGTARAGTTKYRIPLANKTAGAKLSGGGAGLTI